MKYLRLFVVALLCGFFCGSAQAQNVGTAYQVVAQQRADKIVAGLGIKNKDRANRVSQLIAQQYVKLNHLQTNRDKDLKMAATDTAKAYTIKKNTDALITKLHAVYVGKLSKELTPEQVEEVKNGMTYHTVPITYTNYLLMLPYATAEQQTKIKAYLIEARELAMDGGSAKEKQGWFGKYKGRIANYLSGEGYNLKQEGDDWAKRRDTASRNVAITQSNAIVKLLRLDTSNKADIELVRNLIALQYQKIAFLNAERNQKLKQLKDSTGLSKESREKVETQTWTAMKAALEKNRIAYLSKLALFINKQQIEQVQNGMTYNALNKEYDHFLALLPGLKPDEKKKVYDYLMEARDNAMSTLTSREINQWFAKYRGRANNYLAAQGYNLRQATEDLERKTGKAQ